LQGFVQQKFGKNLVAALRFPRALSQKCLGGGADRAPDGALFVVILGERPGRAPPRDSDRLLAVLINEQSSDHPDFEPIGVHSYDNVAAATLGAIFTTSF